MARPRLGEEERRGRTIGVRVTEVEGGSEHKRRVSPWEELACAARREGTCPLRRFRGTSRFLPWQPWVAAGRIRACAVSAPPAWRSRHHAPVRPPRCHTGSGDQARTVDYCRNSSPGEPPCRR